MTGTTKTIDPNRAQLLTRSSATDTTVTAAGVTTAVLEAGDGPPMVLLHGPGEFGGTWLPVLDDLAATHRVVAPDLPGHGASDAPDGGIDRGRASTTWLEELIAATCPMPPVLVGRVVGGAIAAEFAAAHPDRVSELVLVDTMGLAPFEPDPRFGLALHRFLGRPDARAPTSGSWTSARSTWTPPAAGSATAWAPYAGYAVELARDPRVQAATGAIIGLYGAQATPARAARRDQRADHADLGPAGRRDPARRRRGSSRALRLAAARRRRRGGRPRRWTARTSSSRRCTAPSERGAGHDDVRRHRGRRPLRRLPDRDAAGPARAAGCWSWTGRSSPATPSRPTSCTRSAWPRCGAGG